MRSYEVERDSYQKHKRAYLDDNFDVLLPSSLTQTYLQRISGDLLPPPDSLISGRDDLGVITVGKQGVIKNDGPKKMW